MLTKKQEKKKKTIKKKPEMTQIIELVVKNIRR